MLYSFSTLKELREAVEALIAELGENTHCGTGTINGGIDDFSTLEWVVIDKDTLEIVGTEAKDSEKNLEKNRVNAVLIK